MTRPSAPGTADGTLRSSSPIKPPDIRRGLHGNMLMVDRFIGKARTAQDFYRVMRSFLAPVRLICGSGVAV